MLSGYVNDIQGAVQVKEDVTAWVVDRVANNPAVPISGGLAELRLGMHWIGDSHHPSLARALAQLTLGIVSTGGSVVIPKSSSHLTSSTFMESIVGSPNDEDGQNPAAPPLEQFVASLTFGATLQGQIPGLHVMDMPAANIDWVETATGLGSTSVHCMVVFVHQEEMKRARRPSHPFIPTIFVCVVEGDPATSLVSCESAGCMVGADAVVHKDESEATIVSRLLAIIADTLSNKYVPVNNRINNTDFQVTRGLSSISL